MSCSQVPNRDSCSFSSTLRYQCKKVTTLPRASHRGHKRPGTAFHRLKKEPRKRDVQPRAAHTSVMHPQTDICIHPSLVLLPKLFHNQYGAAPPETPWFPTTIVVNQECHLVELYNYPNSPHRTGMPSGKQSVASPIESTPPPSQTHTCTHKMSSKYNPTHMQLCINRLGSHARLTLRHLLACTQLRMIEIQYPKN